MQAVEFVRVLQLQYGAIEQQEWLLGQAARAVSTLLHLCPYRVEIEPQGFTQQWRSAITGKGHSLQASNRPWGNMQAVFKSRCNGMAQAASDPRGDDIGW